MDCSQNNKIFKTGNFLLIIMNLLNKDFIALKLLYLSTYMNYAVIQMKGYTYLK